MRPISNCCETFPRLVLSCNPEYCVICAVRCYILRIFKKLHHCFSEYALLVSDILSGGSPDGQLACIIVKGCGETAEVHKNPP